MNKVIKIIAISLLTISVNILGKNQKTTTNLEVQKQVDTSQTKKPKTTQAQPTLLKEEDKIKF